MRDHSQGYTSLEILFVVAISGVISAMAFPMMSNSVGFYRLDGDARSLKNAVTTARLQAAANFAQTRLYLDYTVSGYHTETKASAAAPWVPQSGTTYLSARGEQYSFGGVATPPPSTQAAIAQASACMSDAVPPAPIANTSCIVFNSRGIPIDATGAPTSVDALYLTDGVSVYGLTVSATSSIRLWRTKAVAAPTWVAQ